MRVSIRRRVVLVAIAAATAVPLALSAVPASADSSCTGNSTCANYDLTPTSGGSGSLGVTLGGSISAATIIGRAEDWVSQSVPYTGSPGNWDNPPWSFWTDSQVGGPYRQDCSGLVSMAWGLNVNTNTGGLPAYSHELTANGNPDPSQLQKGDALIAGGHTVIFDGWYNSAHTEYYAIEQTPPNAIGDPTNPDIIPYPYWTTGGVPDGAVSGEFGDTYWPYRYNNVSTATTSPGPLGDLLQFNRETGGAWSDNDITSHAGLDRATAISLPFSDSPLSSPGTAATAAAAQPVQTTDSSGDISVMAINGSNQLVQFNRPGSGTNANDWGEFNITTSNGGQDHATAISEPFQDSNGDLSEIAINGSGNLDQFNRASGGKWTTFNITKSPTTWSTPEPQFDNVTTISDPFIDSRDGDLSVIAINTSGQLVQFNRASGGAWSEFNITTSPSSGPNLADASAITDPFVDTNGDLSVMAIDASGQLGQFNRIASGTNSGSWDYYNITQANSLDKVSAITEPFTDTNGDLSEMAINTSGQLVQLNRNGNSWSEANIGVGSSLSNVTAIAEPFTESNGDLSVIAINTSGQLVQDNRTTTSGPDEWTQINIGTNPSPNLDNASVLTAPFIDTDGYLSLFAIKA